MKYDVFICHASEDKGFVEPLAKTLKGKGLAVWYDKFEITIGDSLRQKIDDGLANSRYGIVVLSEAFFRKDWPQSELDALEGRQNKEGRKVILPILHLMEAEQVRNYSLLLASLFAAQSSDGLDALADQILDVCSQSGKTKTLSATSRRSAKKALKAIDLFGGLKEIKKKMCKVIREGLEKKIMELQKGKNFDNNDILTAIAKHLEIEPKKLQYIYYKNSNKEVSFRLFERLEIPLGISLLDALGRPHFVNEEQKKRWLKECQEHSLIPVTATPIEDSNILGPMTGIDILQQNLELYVKLRALKEIEEMMDGK